MEVLCEFQRSSGGGFGWVMALGAAWCLGNAPPASAQTVYDGALTSAQQAEVVAWSTLYWQRMDQGGGSPGTGFSFSAASMNSALFNPMRAARPTLEKVGSVSPDACDTLGSLDMPTDAGQIAMRAAFKDAMLEGKIQTDFYQDPGGTVQHANLILAAPISAGLTVYVDGTKLVSLDLPLAKVDAAAYQATLAMNLSAQSQGIIAAMIASGAQWAADAGTVSEAQKAITGQASRADRFAATVQGMLDILGVHGSSTQIIFANFGVYGSLPVLCVQLGDSLVLLDVLNGNLSGPFAPDSKLDATGLLSGYGSIFVLGTGVEYYNSDGCPTTLAAYWHPGPPPVPTVPRSPFPGAPPAGPPCVPGRIPCPAPPNACYPPIPPYNPANPAGGWTNCACSGLCGPFFCVVVEQRIGGTPPIMYPCVHYLNCGGGATAPAGCPPVGCTSTGDETWY